MPLTRIDLISGRKVEISEIRLNSTYGGMLEGYPFARWNDAQLSGAIQRAEMAFPTVPVHLVPPRRELPDLTGGPFGPVELLPSVTCLGLFTSHPVAPALNPVLHYSALTVVWFQDAATVPSADCADPALLTIPWEELARDSER
ncbi:hypothetical protein ACGFZK_15420 [Streptomyces sp. NPDC048257]|uniref:hypothetical protein n=1 Tax=Streptomyces sp. NPDC048257 TaxID=3365526 RepID=UPI00371DC5AB